MFKWVGDGEMVSRLDWQERKDPEEQSWKGIVNDIANEVASLKMLTSLCFYFPTVDSLTTFIASWNDIIPVGIGEVLQQATAFELIGHCNVQSLSDFGMTNMKSLEVCVIEECNDMRSIVDGCNNVVGSVFPRGVGDGMERRRPVGNGDVVIWGGRTGRRNGVAITMDGS
ncbi:hypothetical protein U1Q18_031442 [Sarracenia purpurea var. burkii]